MKTFKEFLLEGKGDTDFHKYSKNTLAELEELLKHHKEDLAEYDEEDEGCDRDSIVDDIKEIEDAIKAKGEVLEGYKQSPKTKKELQELSGLASKKDYSVEDDEDGKSFNVYDDGGNPVKTGTYTEIKKLLNK